METEVRQANLLKIEVSSGWKAFTKIYGDKRGVRDRLDWFLYEFGKRTTRLFFKHLEQELKTVKGNQEYKKRLVVAEIRDKGKRSWFAVVASAKGLDAGKYDPNKTLFEVVARFKIKGDPVYEILQTMGPWTIETLPFVPSDRQGTVLMKKTDEKSVQKIKDKNFSNGSRLESKMVLYGIPYEKRDDVYKKLKVVRDLEVEAIAMEFGLRKEGRPHWRPSLRWLKKNVVTRMTKDKDLIRVWLDPAFNKYRVRRRLQLQLTQVDVKRLSEFQDKIRM